MSETRAPYAAAPLRARGEPTNWNDALEMADELGHFMRTYEPYGSPGRCSADCSNPGCIARLITHDGEIMGLALEFGCPITLKDASVVSWRERLRKREQQARFNARVTALNAAVVDE